MLHTASFYRQHNTARFLSLTMHFARDGARRRLNTSCYLVTRPD
jgi:hypothetical protein